MDHNDAWWRTVSGTDVALDRAGNGWPRGTTVALGAAGAIGMVLITVSGVAVGPTGPTGSSVERGILTFVPKGTAATVLGAVTMTVGLDPRARLVDRARPVVESAAPSSGRCTASRARGPRRSSIGPPDLQPRPLQLRGRRDDGHPPHQPVRARPCRARRVEVPRAREPYVAHHAVALRPAVPAARELRRPALGWKRRQLDHDPAHCSRSRASC